MNKINKLSITSKRKLVFVLTCFQVAFILLVFRVFYIIIIKGPELQEKAFYQQTRDRLISPNRGSILDRNMEYIANTETVASISVIHNQVTDKEKVASILSKELDLEYDYVLQKVEKVVALERIKTKVDKETANRIRDLELNGVVLDEDIKRVYPYSNLASQVIGFVGKDNQGIIGLEAKYDEYLKGSEGKIMTETDVRGKEIKGGNEYRVPPEDGYNLVTSIDITLQQYAEQTLDKVLEQTQAKRASIIMMNPKNGEILTMANKPDFDLNDPFTINDEKLFNEWDYHTEEEKNNLLNQMWRNFTINDTYEPGSTFKIITSVTGLQEDLLKIDDVFVCTGSKLVGGRMIKCWRHPRSHGTISFVEGVYNSCNPVFMEIGERIGSETFYEYLDEFGFNEKTGIDVPGEAVGIMHPLENVGPVELATMSFGQSFQITPMQLLRAASAVINGGKLITPHFGLKVVDDEGDIIEVFNYEEGKQVISNENSEIMKEILEGVVYTGTGNKTYIPGYRVGGKTATSEKLPRGQGKYIASFLAFAPAEDPEVITLVLIDEPKGAYYGGQIAGPVMKEILSNALPYLNITPKYNEEEEELPEVATVLTPNLIGLPIEEARKIAKELELDLQIIGQGKEVKKQFPMENEVVNKGSKLLVYIDD